MGDLGLYDTAPFVNAPRKLYEVEYNARDSIIYALGIGSKNPKYLVELHPEFTAFPTFPLSLTFKGHSYDVMPFPPPVLAFFEKPNPPGYQTTLDAIKSIEKIHDIPAGARMKLHGSIVCALKKGPGIYIEQEWDLIDDSGKVYFRMVSGLFNTGCHSFTECGKVHFKDPPKPEGEPFASKDVVTDER